MIVRMYYMFHDKMLQRGVSLISRQLTAFD